MPTINPWAVLLSTLAGFVIGGLWYSPLLFERIWMRSAGLTAEELEGGSKLRIFGGAAALILVAAFNLAAFLGEDPSLVWGATAGALTAIWVACALGVVYLFEHRGITQFLINAGYWLVTFTTMGAILAAV